MFSEIGADFVVSMLTGSPPFVIAYLGRVSTDIYIYIYIYICIYSILYYDIIYYICMPVLKSSKLTDARFCNTGNRLKGRSDMLTIATTSEEWVFLRCFQKLNLEK